ncbi:MAG TPA: NAD-dependent deacylase [Bryobacteraceae bacterium]|nr:NAD-dependent deacylase [Bryobacteraceae bacterium]
MDPLQRCREILAQADSIAALTGAGISAESGIPTFRGAGGLWRSHRAEDLATPQGFARDPKLVWEWYDWRRSFIAQAEPNPGHRALAALESRHANFTLITQNVDGLHDRAGSTNALKVHGDVWTLRCTACHREREDRRAQLPELPPLCACGAMERPGVVWFGESLPQDVWKRAEQTARRACVLLVIGTSAVVYPAAGLVGLAKSAGARVIEINIGETPVSSIVDVSLRGPAAEILPQLIS